MPIIVLLNHVNLDGTGDFSHLVDIYQALTENPRLQDYEFIPVISVAPNQYEKIKSRLGQLKAKKYFLTEDTKNFDDEPDLQHYLSQAEQIILVSHAVFPGMEEYKKHFNPQALLKFFGEHEGSPDDIRQLEKSGWNNRSLGLSGTCRGLKLTQEKRLQLRESLAVMASEGGQPFLDALLRHSGSVNLDAFVQTNELIPAYFNQYGFEAFLLFLALNPALFPGKNVAVFLSGNSVLKQDFEFPQTGQIKQVEMVKSDGSVETIYDGNPDGNQVIRIFQGFNLPDKAYRALYQQAPYAGISGDNTFEMALSNKIFPFYHSSNFMMKKPTLLALADIIKGLPLSPALKSDYAFYFRKIGIFCSIKASKNSKIRMPVVNRFGLLQEQHLDFPAMVAAWPSIANYLYENYNFYKRLEEILLENVSPAKDSEEKHADEQPADGQVDTVPPPVPIIKEEGPKLDEEKVVEPTLENERAVMKENNITQKARFLKSRDERNSAEEAEDIKQYPHPPASKKSASGN